MRQLIAKASRALSHQIVHRTRPFPFYPFLYRSTMHAIFARQPTGTDGLNFLTAIPHIGAGVGHQIANWIAGYWFAEQFGCQYAHAPFNDKTWENLLGFGTGEVSLAEVRLRGYRPIRLPLFDEDNAREMARIRRIIGSYRGKQVLFLLERDQFHRAQHGVMKQLATKFDASPSKRSSRLVYDPTALNIAVHVRRGDVSLAAAAASSNIMMRWQEVDYFERVLESVLDHVADRGKVQIYLFSQGSTAEFASFSHHSNLHLCTDMDAPTTFLHLAAADVLIGSKSGFSYCPALLGHGVRVLPTPFWHDYPNDPLWVTADAKGKFNGAKLAAALALVICSKQSVG